MAIGLLIAVLQMRSAMGAAVAGDLERAGDTIAIQQILVGHIVAERPSWHG
jgi:hypothetical protein